MGDGMFADQPLEMLQKQFEQYIEQEGNSQLMAAFFRHESEGSLHCSVKVYLTPSAVDFANARNASSCMKPGPEGLSLLSGSIDVWQEQFPHYHY
jgi:hypothetical protein